MHPHTKQQLELFDKSFNQIDNFGVIYGKDNSIVCSTNGNQLEAIKVFLQQALLSQAEYIRAEMVPDKETIDDGLSDIFNNRIIGYNMGINIINKNLDNLINSFK